MASADDGTASSGNDDVCDDITQYMKEDVCWEPKLDPRMKISQYVEKT